jgi:hypothetical protein
MLVRNLRGFRIFIAFKGKFRYIYIGCSYICTNFNFIHKNKIYLHRFTGYLHWENRGHQLTREEVEAAAQWYRKL